MKPKHLSLADIDALTISKIAESLPDSYAFISDGSLVWIHPGDPQYEAAKRAYELKCKQVVKPAGGLR